MMREIACLPPRISKKEACGLWLAKFERSLGKLSLSHRVKKRISYSRQKPLLSQGGRYFYSDESCAVYTERPFNSSSKSPNAMLS
jgi:hypothetical protein